MSQLIFKFLSMIKDIPDEEVVTVGTLKEMLKDFEYKLTHEYQECDCPACRARGDS